MAWIDPETGLKLKMKADAWNIPARHVADLKSAWFASKHEFKNACAKYFYHLSSALYVEGVYRVTGERVKWSFIACEKNRPHSVLSYDVSESFMRRGHRDLRRALDNVARWKERGEYPPMQADGRSETIDLPTWF